jgi:acyl-homoserine-lactone acylase
MVSDGSSTVQMTEFTDHGPKANWLLTYSQSENPDSKHFDDQTKQFSKSRFIRQVYTNKQIKKDPSLKVTKLKGK